MHHNKTIRNLYLRSGKTLISKFITFSILFKLRQFGIIFFHRVSSSEDMIELCIKITISKTFRKSITSYRMIQIYTYRMHYVRIHNTCIFKAFEIERPLITVKYIPIAAAWKHIKWSQWLKNGKVICFFFSIF